MFFFSFKLTHKKDTPIILFAFSIGKKLTINTHFKKCV